MFFISRNSRRIVSSRQQNLLRIIVAENQRNSTFSAALSNWANKTDNLPIKTFQLQDRRLNNEGNLETIETLAEK